MQNDDLTIRFEVDRTPQEAFAAINDVRGWWTGDIVGPTDELGGEFTYRHEDIHRSTQRVTDLVPGERVAWHVTDGYLSFVQDTAEWTGTDITFDIAATPTGSEVVFTHVGLRPQDECYHACSNAWGFYVGTSLRQHITAVPVAEPAT